MYKPCEYCPYAKWIKKFFLDAPNEDCPNDCPSKLIEDAIPAEACENDFGIYYRPTTDIIIEEDYVLVINDPSRENDA